MAYAPLIYLSEEAETKLRSYLRTEILDHNAERGPYLDKIKEYMRLYWADPDPDSGTGPVQGGATIVIPLIAISVEAFHARNMTTLFGLEDFCQFTLPAEFQELESSLEQLMDHELLRVADLYKFADNALLENIKLGSAIGKTGYERVVKKAVRVTEGADGTREREEFDVVTRQGLTIDAVQVSNFLLPYAYTDPQLAPWCGEEHERSLFELKTLEQSGMFYEGTYEALLNFYTPYAADTPGNEVKREAERLEDKQPVFPKTIRWYEVYMTFDVDEDGRDEEIVVHYHQTADKIMSIRYNEYDDLHRPYRIVNHFPLEHRWTGIGMAKMLEQFQIEVTTQHRQTIDNATLANLRMFKVKRLANVSPNEPIFPGKLWFVDDLDDIEPFQAGEVYPSSYNSEASAVQYAQQRSAINDLSLGMSSAGTPGTAADILARVQEGNRRFDYSYKNVRRFMGQIVLDSLCVINKYGPRNIAIYDQFHNGSLLRSFLETNPPSYFREQIIAEVNIAGQSQNKLLDRQSWTQLSGMAQQYWQAMLQLAMQTGNQELAMMISQRAMQSGSEIFKQILESFDIRNPYKLILRPEELGGQQPIQPGVGLPEGIGAPIAAPGMGSPLALPQISGASSISGL